jgi:hypothetical protein
MLVGSRTETPVQDIIDVNQNDCRYIINDIPYRTHADTLWDLIWKYHILLRINATQIIRLLLALEIPHAIF